MDKAHKCTTKDIDMGHLYVTYVDRDHRQGINMGDRNQVMLATSIR